MAIFNCSVLARQCIFFSFLKRSDQKQIFVSNKRNYSYFRDFSFRKPSLKYLYATVPVTAIGAGYYYYSNKEKAAIDENFIPKILEHTVLSDMPKVKISRSIKGVKDDHNLNLTLFQYPTCPFCCKVRAFLDYYGLPYDVIEVDPVLRQQTSWTTYKKVPILLAKIDEGYQQLNDSSMIISVLKSYLLDKKLDLSEILTNYPMVEFKEKGGKTSADIFNKYFLMYHENVPVGKNSQMIKEEKNWREWADNELVHVLSPNVYRTKDEALQAFKWFSEVGEWDKLFPAWERNLIIYVGAYAMWLISKRLKKRHNLKEDVRESLYDSCKKWMKLIKEKGTVFMGGNFPNLADLAVYGVLSSIEGCIAFNDLLENTNIDKWYFPMKEAIKNHLGKKEIINYSS